MPSKKQSCKINIIMTSEQLVYVTNKGQLYGNEEFINQSLVQGGIKQS